MELGVPIGWCGKDRDRESGRITTGLFSSLAQTSDGASRLPTSSRSREPAVTELDDPPYGVIGFPSQENRRVWVLLRFRVKPYRVEVDKLPVKFGFLSPPEFLHCEHPLAKKLESGLILGTVVFHLFDIPPAADGKQKAAIRELVEARDRLRGDDRITLRHKCDAGADLERSRRGGGKGECDKGVVCVHVPPGQLAAAWKRRAPAHRDVRVLADEQRLESALFQCPRKLDGTDAVICREIEHTDAHGHGSSGPTATAAKAVYSPVATDRLPQLATRSMRIAITGRAEIRIFFSWGYRKR